ncbi:ethionine resistance protein [Pichia californica]|uniref:Ethionine resistance protein n=1 Tax=Pichia californica TaxID=460514 RepID=A0A9P6WK31_9ASCO|nr:ethionine resistance protein [[Candida] californica]KAG0688629.1 ethionine resistance protein [[Candida] californica]
MSLQFNYTTSQRRASTTIVGSIGRSGLYVPQDFINYDKKKIGSVLDSMEHDLDPEDEHEDEDQDQDHFNSIDSQPTLIRNHSLNSINSNTNNNSNNTLTRPSRHKKSRRESEILLNDEINLLKANGIQISKNISNSSSSQQNINNIDNNNSLNYNSIAIVDDNDNDDDNYIIESWDDAVKNGKIKTTTNLELKTLIKSSIPLIITFILQNSLSVCSIFAVGHISSEALAGITLGAMTSNITAMATIAGLASSLDTFLPQAYGAKKFHLVGLIFQRCTVLIFTIMIVVCSSWWIWSETLLTNFLPDKKSAIYASQYLKVTSFGIPGYILFETGKRFLQSQGIFDASTYVLFICAPLNAILNYLLVWYFNFGYIGAPIAVSINYTLMAFGLFLFTINTKNEINPLKCWTKLNLNKIFKNWSELIKLSIPNLIMIVSEFLSFEILTLLASYLGTIPLASQSIIATTASLAYQIPYGVSIASSTRVANFLGAQLPKSAFVTCKATYIFTILISIINFSLIYFGKSIIANWFSNDLNVVKLSEKVFPLIAFMQIFDALNTTSAGCLRGQGLQRIGGYVNIFSYYIVGLPLGAYLGFNFPNKENPSGLLGLWSGSIVALIIIGSVQTYFSLHADFDKLVNDAVNRSNSD